MTMKQTFYSNGKLLITGEYLVLDGAKSLALPTKFGQDLVVEPGCNQEIKWKSFDKDGTVWFEDCISFSEIIHKTNIENQEVKNTLIAILHEAFLLNSNFIRLSKGYVISTHLTFPKYWGLGTSSTLINNIAQWLHIDAFILLKNSFGGSGYDIACAQNPNPILFQLSQQQPVVEKIPFNPVFTEKLYFVYLNKKQNSKKAIQAYRDSSENTTEIIPKIDEITLAAITAPNFETFSLELEKHEKIMSEILKIKTVKESRFPDFKGTLKSLGAWGGDFILAASKENPTRYFNEKGYNTVIPYVDIIL